MQLTANFGRSEFRCRCADRGLARDASWCGGESWPHRELVERLQTLRNHFGAAITINSGCRCPAYNSAIGGAPMSQHKRGTAADIVVAGVEPPQVAQAARRYGLYVLEYPRFTHVDVRNYI